MLKALQQHLAAAPLKFNRAANGPGSMPASDGANAATTASRRGSADAPSALSALLHVQPQPASSSSMQQGQQLGSQAAAQVIQRDNRLQPPPHQQGGTFSPDSDKCSFPAAAAAAHSCSPQHKGVDQPAPTGTAAGQPPCSGNGGTKHAADHCAPGGSSVAEPQHSGNTSGIFDGLFDLEDNWAL